MNKVLYKGGDRPFYCTQAQADALDRLASLPKGGIGSIKGYRPTSGCIPGCEPVHDLQILTRFEYPRLLNRAKLALESVTFADCAADIAKHPKLSSLSAAACLAQFEASKEAALASIATTLTGDRSDAHRQGHDRCYVRVAEGVKVNLETVKVEGLEQPVLTDGYPTAKTIMLSYLELHKTVRVEGQYKVVNSGPKVLMDNIIKSKLNARSVGIKTLSLKADNFESLSVGRQTFTPDDLRTIAVDMPASKLRALLEAAGFSDEAARIVEALGEA